jgi:hypothetical protein
MPKKIDRSGRRRKRRKTAKNLVSASSVTPECMLHILILCTIHIFNGRATGRRAAGGKAMRLFRSLVIGDSDPENIFPPSFLSIVTMSFVVTTLLQHTFFSFDSIICLAFNSFLFYQASFLKSWSIELLGSLRHHLGCRNKNDNHRHLLY